LFRSNCQSTGWQIIGRVLRSNPWSGERKKRQTFFKQGQENEAAQQAQHDILVKFAETGRKGSVTPIVDVLEIEGQTQSILITSTGVVVNGNRRLAGMRDLYAKSANDHRSFSHVKCMVLPAGVTESEIVEIEIRLQMKQRTELDYDWIVRIRGGPRNGYARA
jgi:hypothetical protein